MRRLLLGTAVMAACSTGYALAGDLDVHRVRLAVVVALWWVVSVLTIRWVLRRTDIRTTSPRAIAVALFVVALAVQLPGLLSGPRSSSDAYRYVWDGRVQLSGTSPYRYVPLDDRLAPLRDPILFPGVGPTERSGVTTTPLPKKRSELLARSRNDPRTVINRPQVPTIYPPVAQSWFTAVAAVTPWSWGTRGLQLGSALLAAGTTGALVALLRRSGRDPWAALWWAWCPTVVAEAGNGAHVDVLAAALVVASIAAVGFSVRRRGALGTIAPGVLAGLAIAVKLYPAVILATWLPLRRNVFRVAAAGTAAALTLLAVYLPHWLAAGPLVLGYLPGYLLEESGNRSGILSLVLPDAAVTPVTVLALASVAGFVAWRATPEGHPEPAVGATVVLGALVLLTTPSYPWYCLPLIACAVLAGRLEWLAVAVAAGLAYASASVPLWPTIAYAAAALVVLVAWARRSGHFVNAERGPSRRSSWRPCRATPGSCHRRGARRGRRP
ncbi:MAG: glycosyltransferase 87 family protein [Knoellia sp.]